MPEQETQHLFIYRMTHIDNVPFIVKNPEAGQKVAAMLGDTLPGCEITVDSNFEYYYREYD